MSPNASPTKRFSKFVPRAQKKELKNQMINEMQEFMYTPKKLFCPKHKDTEIEFCCVINETFYCKLCIPNHLGHDDLVLADVCKSVQEDVIKLKHTYV